MVEQKVFSGIMDSDSPVAKVAPANHVFAKNVVFRGNAGNYRVENILGNRIVANANLPINDVCPILTGLVFRVVANVASFYFNPSPYPTTEYTVSIKNASTDVVVATQNITVPYGRFTGLADGNYYIEAFVLCANEVNSGAVDTGDFTINNVVPTTCPVVTNVVIAQNGTNILYSFTSAGSDAITYTIILYKNGVVFFTATNSSLSGAIANGGVGTYNMTVQTNCNGSKSTIVNSNTIIIDNSLNHRQYTISLGSPIPTDKITGNIQIAGDNLGGVAVFASRTADGHYLTAINSATVVFDVYTTTVAITQIFIIVYGDSAKRYPTKSGSTYSWAGLNLAAGANLQIFINQGVE